MLQSAVKVLDTFFPIFGTKRTKEIFQVNPTVIPERQEARTVIITVYEYTATHLQVFNPTSITECLNNLNPGYRYWINVDGLRKADVEKLSEYMGVHALLVEDILSVGQRAKMDEMDNHIFCLLNMLYFDDQAATVDQEQISLLMGKNYVVSFQEDAQRDVFDGLRDRMKLAGSKLRTNDSAYLLYLLIDQIVDNYFLIMERLSERIELLEEEIIRYGTTRSLARINGLRKEMIVLKRNVLPVRDVVSKLLNVDSDLLDDRMNRYFRDVYDHIIQAADLTENYRDMMMTLQDLYLNKNNMRMNEVMKVMAIVTCLLAPATVIGGIFGMNFDHIPWLHNQNGFWIAVSIMVGIPLYMIWLFRKRGWF
jgi:magnesium transporter